MNKLNYIFLILISFALTSCASNKESADKIKKNLKEINVEEIKKEGLASTSSIYKEGPSIGFNNTTKPRREMSSSSSKISFPNFPVTIKFVNSDLREALVGLGNLASKNIIVDHGVKGILNYSVTDEPWNNVVNSIIEMNGLMQSTDSNSGFIKISGGSGSSQSQMTEIFNIFYQTPSIIKPQIESLLAGDPVAGGNQLTLIENDDNKTLIAKGSPSDLMQIETILDKIDVKKPQVLIEAFLVEVSPSFSSKLGTRLGLTKTRSAGNGGITNTIRGGVGTAGSDVALGNDVASATNFLISGTSGLGIIRETSSGELKLEIDALESEGDSKTLSNPKLFTISGKNAIIKQGTQFGVQDSTTADGATTTTTKYYDANLQLDVTPIITGDGNVVMELKITNDTVDLSEDPPAITKKEIDTNLILADGDIAVVGGILTETLSETNNRVPGLGKIPGIGALFRSKANVNDRQELLIFLAPRII